LSNKVWLASTNVIENRLAVLTEHFGHTLRYLLISGVSNSSTKPYKVSYPVAVMLLRTCWMWDCETALSFKMAASLSFCARSRWIFLISVSVTGSTLSRGRLGMGSNWFTNFRGVFLLFRARLELAMVSRIRAYVGAFVGWHVNTCPRNHVPAHCKRKCRSLKVPLFNPMKLLPRLEPSLYQVLFNLKYRLVFYPTEGTDGRTEELCAVGIVPIETGRSFIGLNRGTFELQHFLLQCAGTWLRGHVLTCQPTNAPT
jgi:hypothetical protein